MATRAREGRRKRLHRARCRCRGRSAGVLPGIAALFVLLTALASREQGAQRVQVDARQHLELVERDVLVQLVDAGVDRAELDHLGADLDDEARVRGAAGGGDLSRLPRMLLRGGDDQLLQAATLAEEGLRAKQPGDRVIEAVLVKN